jgi:hypothetical protein
MRRLWAISAFALFLAVPVWAQHGGGHAGGGGGGGHAGFGGGGHGGFSGGGHAGGFSGGSSLGRSSGSGVHAYSGPLSRSFAPRAFTPPASSRSSSLSLGQQAREQRALAQRGLSQRAFSRPLASQNRFRGRGGRTYGYGYGLRNNCIGYPCRGYYGGYYSPWAWGYGGYYDPYWWWDSGSGYDDGYDQDLATANDMNAQNLNMEDQQMMSQEEADGDQDAYARPYSSSSQREGAPVLPDTVLVFRDQHKQEVHNYAIVGQTLWSFAPQHTEKIPLSDLDLAATTKANGDRGLTFRVPGVAEAQ